MHFVLANADSLFDTAISYFLHDYVKSMQSKSTFKASISWRYLISDSMSKHYGMRYYIPLTSEDWTPIFTDNVYWSLSHKDDIVFVWTAEQRVWVDLEVVRPRSPEVFNLFSEKEQAIIWEKNFENFYLIWTAKESLIKCVLGKLDDMKEINMVSIEAIDLVIDWMSFEYRLILLFRGESYEVCSWRKDMLRYSFCIRK